MKWINNHKQELSAALLGCYCAVIVWITILGRQGIVENPMNFQVFHSFRSIGIQILNHGIFGNFLGNIILFVPFGLLLSIVSKWMNWRKITISGMIFSTIIETIQLITSKGFFEIDDIILNTTGALIGFGILCMLRYLVTKLT